MRVQSQACRCHCDESVLKSQTSKALRKMALLSKKWMRPQPDCRWQAINMNSSDNSFEHFCLRCSHILQKASILLLFTLSDSIRTLATVVREI